MMGASRLRKHSSCNKQPRVTFSVSFDESSDSLNRLSHFITSVSQTSIQLHLGALVRPRFLTQSRWETILTEIHVRGCCGAYHLASFTFYGHVWFSVSPIPVKAPQCEPAFRKFELVTPYARVWGLLTEGRWVEYGQSTPNGTNPSGGQKEQPLEVCKRT